MANIKISTKTNYDDNSIIITFEVDVPTLLEDEASEALSLLMTHAVSTVTHNLREGAQDPLMGL